MIIVPPQLWSWFADNFRPWLANLAWSVMDAFARLMGPWALVLLKIAAVVWILLEGLRWAVPVMSEAVASIVFSGLFKPNSTLLVYGAFINRFVPLVECFAMVVLMAHLWIAVIILRWAKSFIPLWSN